MPVEESLYRQYLRQSFQSLIVKVACAQEFIPFHIEKLTLGDQEMRNDFRYLQRWYTRALNLSLEQVREYMHLVDHCELEGFSVEPITRKIESEGDGDEDGSDDIVMDMGFKTRREFEAFIADNMPVDSPLNVAIPSTTQKTQSLQKDPATPPTYDENGFYVGENNTQEQIEEPEEAPLTRVESQSPLSWADEVEEAEEAGLLGPSSSDFDLEASLCFSLPSPSPDYEMEDRPLSDALRSLLENIGADANITRTNRVVTLTTEELDQLDSDWTSKVKDKKEKEKEAIEKGRRQPYEESVEESDLLDAWDYENGRFYWQTEGLFLCRLTELVHKKACEEARRIWWIEVKVAPEYEANKNPRPSPLRNELLM
ncbi:hypothetical protein F5B21DRAFT_491632 [Xylaria acuta]|nr:hypothetical protein F5B21DRAFT_491632 [Xylaria acuta]